MAKRRIIADRKPSRISYLGRSPSEPLEVMSLDESETLLDSSSGTNVYPGGGNDFQTPSSTPFPDFRDNSMGSIATQSTTLTSNSRQFISPAVTVVDIDLKVGSLDEYDENQPPPPVQRQRRAKRIKSYDGLIEGMPGKAKGNLLQQQTASVGESGEAQASGGLNWDAEDSIWPFVILMGGVISLQ